MECQRCHKNDASVHYTQVINGKKDEVHLCEECAEKEGYMDFSNQHLSMHQFLTSMVPLDSAFIKSQSIKPETTTQCDYCGMTYGEFRRKGKFGCSHCYESFSSYLTPLLKRVHSGNTEHVGKIPKRIGGNLHKQREVESLQTKLQEAIQAEAFEEAATIRDQIHQLKQELEEERKGGEA